MASPTPANPGAPERATLDNGIRVVAEPMPWLPTASFAVLVPFGSTTDPDGLAGASAVLLEWTQRGAGGFGARGYSEALDDLGVRRGYSAGREVASVRGSVLADALPDALELVALALREPRLEDEPFRASRALAAEDLASLDDNPAQRMFEELRARFFVSGHRRSVYGSREGLAALDADALRDDAARRLAPAGTIVAIAGGTEARAAITAVERAFGGWRGGGEPLPPAETRPPFREHVAAPTNQVQIGLAYESLPADHPEWYAQALAMAVLSGGMGSRLHTEVREKRGLVYSVAASPRTLRGFGYTLGYAGTTPERAERTLEVVLAEIARLGDGVEADEFDRARRGLVADLVMQGESSGARAAALARDVFLRGAPRTLAEVRRVLAATDLERVNAWLASRARPEPRVLTLGPDGTAAPAAAELAESADPTAGPTESTASPSESPTAAASDAEKAT